MQYPHDSQGWYIQLPNARAGQSYMAEVIISHTQTYLSSDSGDLPVNTGDIQIKQLLLPPQLGLVFDAPLGTLHGIPQQAGEFALTAILQVPDQLLPLEVSFNLLVIPDPRTLWQIREPVAGQPFTKPHTDHQQQQAEWQRMAGASCRGRAHEHAGSFRDDDFGIALDADSGFGLMVVCDGAGSACYSREGARLAVEQTLEAWEQPSVITGLTDLGNAVWQWQPDDQAQMTWISQFLIGLFRSIAKQVIEAIERAAYQLQKSSRDFATTWLVALTYPVEDGLFVASCWVGDGAIAVLSWADDEPVKLLGQPDSGEYAGQTRFLSRDLIEGAQWQECISMGRFTQPDAVVLLTDGISDPFFDTEAELRKPAGWQTLWQQWLPLLRQPHPGPALLEWQRFFVTGHHDDRTMALWYRNEPTITSLADCT